jgi:hypothetical protein
LFFVGDLCNTPGQNPPETWNNLLMRLISFFLLATLFSPALFAQAASPASDAQTSAAPATGGSTAQTTSGQSQPSSQNDREKQLQRQEQSQRILGVVPQFGLTSRKDAPPLTTDQKYHLFVKSAFDPFQYAAAGLQAGLGQATNEFPGYGQGAEGYGKRYGASIADQVSSNFFANFLYPSLLKQDPRYFRLGEGSIKHRILYSLEQEFVCHTDKGGRSFNWSNVLGAFTSGAISNAYYPSTDRGAGLTVSRSSIALLYGSAGGLVDEFWADIHNKLAHKHSN